MKENEILNRLDTLISLLIPGIDEKNYEIKGLGLEILRLCDYEHTVSDMTKKLKKSRNQIDSNLSKLRSKGMIKSVIKNNETVYIRTR
jgi:predicted DNA-binding protein (UPF0251 family)